MKWFDFADSSFITFFVIIIIAFILLVGVILSYFLLNKTSEIYERKIFDEKKSTRLYILDIKNNKVTYFNRNNIRHKKTNDLANFYNRFHEMDKEHVKTWIFNIVNGHENESPYITADMVLYEKKISYYTFLKVIKFSSETKKVYLESYIFKNITPHSRLNDPKLLLGAMNKERAIKIINTLKTHSGYSFSCRVYRVNSMLGFNINLDRFIADVLNNSVYQLVTKHPASRLLFENEDKELFIVDLKINNKDKALELANTIYKAAKKASETYGFSSEIGISIGVIANRAFYHDYGTIIDRASRTSLQASLNNQEILLYQTNTFTTPLEINRLSSEVESLIIDQNIDYYYRPIVDFKKAKNIGYYALTKFPESSFASLAEACKYAVQINKGKELFAITSKKTINKFANENPFKGSKLFMPVSLNNVTYLQSVLNQISAIKDINLVLVLDELEIIEVTKHQDTMRALFEILNDESLSLAVNIKDRNMMLSSSLYSRFQYFIIDQSVTREIKRSNRARLSIHILIENLKKYKKPIISIDADGWSAIELLLENGLNIISSDTIAPMTKMIVPVENKKMHKVEVLGEKYN